MSGVVPSPIFSVVDGAENLIGCPDYPQSLTMDLVRPDRSVSLIVHGGEYRILLFWKASSILLDWFRRDDDVLRHRRVGITP